MFVGAGLICCTVLFCLKTSARIGGVFPPPETLETKPGHPVTSHLRRAYHSHGTQDQWHEVCNEGRGGFFWVVGKLWGKQVVIKNLVVGWVCYLGDEILPRDFWILSEAIKPRIPINQLYTNMECHKGFHCGSNTPSLAAATSNLMLTCCKW